MEKRLTCREVERRIGVEITEKFIEALDRRVIPWEQPWLKRESDYYGASGKPYGFLNSLLLWLGGQQAGEFVTVDQVIKRTGTSRNGEGEACVWNRFIRKDGKFPEGTYIVFRGKVLGKRRDENGNVVKDKDGNPELVEYWCLKSHKVYRIGTEVDCPRNIPEKTFDKTLRVANPIPRAEKIVLDYVSREGVGFGHEMQGRAFYHPATDRINVPSIENFVSEPAYYQACFHEMAHSTGHSKRLHRPKFFIKGDERYSREELIAEIASAVLLHENGLAVNTTDRNHVAYIQSWGKALKSDPLLIEKAMAGAMAAVEYIYHGKAKK